LSDQLDAFIGGTFTDSVKTIMNYLGVIPFLQDLITDGIIAGVDTYEQRIHWQSSRA
ncbi:hypothetical protein IDG70_04575, partial [Staphylococcus sp. EG-SA-26]|nr:hypothetical protein [Staphylococcus sp. EG-SA-26]